MLWDMKFLYWIFYGSGAIVIKRCGEFFMDLQEIH